MLKPLQQFICDTCGATIEEPSHGVLEWTHDEHGKAHSFRICHDTEHSPLQRPLGCLRLDDYFNALELYTDPGLSRILNFIDSGPQYVTAYKGPKVANLREWTKLMRRIAVPYYEEARQYLEDACDDPSFPNENGAYTEETLKAVIEKYGAVGKR